MTDKLEPVKSRKEFRRETTKDSTLLSQVEYFYGTRKYLCYVNCGRAIPRKVNLLEMVKSKITNVKYHSTY